MIENGVNMGKNPDEYEQNSKCLIKIIAESSPDKHIFAITMFPNFALCGKDEHDPCVKIEHHNDLVLRDIVKKYSNVHLIEGDEILDDFTGLKCDLIHPSDYGHIKMAENLFSRITTIYQL